MRNNFPYRGRSLFSTPPKPQPPRKKWRIRYVLWTALKRTCMTLGAFMLISMLLGVLMSSMALRSIGESSAPAALPHEMVLYLPITETLIEHENSGGYAFREKPLTVRDIVFALDEAAKDKRVKGFVVKMAGGELELAHIEELREAVMRFRDSGKFAWVYAPSYDSLGQYYFASAFEQIWLQPVGIVTIPGIRLEMPYARDALLKLGIEPQFFARKEYKSLFESLESSEMSAASRESLQAVVDSFAGTITQGIAQGRKMEPAAFDKLVDAGLFTGDQALAAGLVDRLDYTDTLNEELKQSIKGDPDNDDPLFAFMSAYLKDRRAAGKLPGAGHKNKEPVALIYVVGNIVQYDQTGADLGAADTLVGLIRDAAEDEDIETIVLRIDSPGGDPTAAETIRRAIVEAKEKEGKQVVVSMGNMAASGGYWIAADADHIFAQPTTLTGSIGVTGGKVSLRELWTKLGINWDGVEWGENASLWSFNRPYSPSEAVRMDMLMDHIYDTFVSIVANGRGMTPEQAEEVARGRVWTGADAQRVGLVDTLGGLEDTLDYVAQQQGLTDRHDLSVIVLPRPQTPFEKIMEFLDMQVSVGSFFYDNRALLADITEGAKALTTAAQPGSGLVLSYE